MLRRCPWPRCLVAAVTLACAAPPAARAQEPPPSPPQAEEAPPPAEGPSLGKPFVDGLRDLRRWPSWHNVTWLGLSLAGAAALRPGDDAVARALGDAHRGSFAPGAILGGAPLQIGGSFATYALGRAIGSPRVTSIGSDLTRAQVAATIVTAGIKTAARRSRPDGGRFSFPSGHTAAAFASATVLQDHLGWKVGVPAYAVASYVALSRVQMQRHYLSDIAFGAAIGIVAGRTVTVGGQPLVLTPLATASGGGIGFTWIGKP